MRLSTRAKRDDDSAIQVIHAALDAGATLLDTADAYCHDTSDTGHNERLIAEALASWSGDRSTVTVATKGGLTRPGGKWLADGKAKHLMAACDASLTALGVDCIDLYQLHAVDPRTALATSVRALRKLVDAGKVRRVGLCNVNVGQIEEARTIVDIAAVQVELNTYNMRYVRNGVVDYCATHGIRLIAHTPLAGQRKRRKFSAEHMLAYLGELRGQVTPIPGATGVDHATSAVRAQQLPLEDEIRDEMDAAITAAPLVRIPVDKRRPSDDADGDVVLVTGIPAAGKSQFTRELVTNGYARLNRDERGGKLSSLVPALAKLLAEGKRRVVLDNTYPSREARNEIIETAWSHGVPVRCVWLTTSVEQAQVNAVRRMVGRYGKLLAPDEMKQANKSDPNVFPPRAQFDYRRRFERPDESEGFASVRERAFEPTPTGYNNRAVVLDLDGRQLSDEEQQQLAAHSDESHALVHLPACPHGGGPPRCWCRKPFPGLIVEAIEHHKLDPAASIYVGDSAAARRMAERMGFRYLDSAQIFGG